MLDAGRFNAMNMFEDLDEFCGDSKMIREAREHIPEPSHHDFPEIRFLEPQKPIDIFSEDFQILKPTYLRTQTMVKIMMVWHGVRFFAWKSKSDGKIYI